MAVYDSQNDLIFQTDKGQENSGDRNLLLDQLKSQPPYPTTLPESSQFYQAFCPINKSYPVIKSDNMTYSADASPIAAWLVEECEKRNLSWSQASLRAGLSRGTVSAIINGQQPGLEVCKALAQFFNVPIEHLLRLAGHLPTPPSPRDAEEEDIITLWRQLPAWKRKDLLVQARAVIEAERRKGQQRERTQSESSDPSDPS